MNPPANDAARFEAARTHFLAGTQALEQGRLDEAAAQLRASLALVPGRPSTLANLGAALLRAGRAAEALPLLQQADAAAPGQVETLGHIGLALATLARTDEALATFERVQQLAPRHLGAWVHHAETAARAGRLPLALASNDRICALAPTLGPAWSQRGALLKDLGRPDEAAAALERAIALGDAVEHNRWLLQALRAAAAPEAPPPGYVQGLFDSYADTFDQALAQLGYQTPQVLAEMLRGIATAAGTAGSHGALGTPWPRALDLGCGTGLMAPLLKPATGTGATLVQRLDGIDLSGAMLEKARARGGYEALHQGDIAQHLAATPERYTLVLAADVFVYLGELRPVFAGVRRVLEPGGLFAFSVERGEPGSGYTLRSSARYAHAREYLMALSAEHGLEPVAEREGVLRHDHGQPVMGLYLALRAPG